MRMRVSSIDIGLSLAALGLALTTGCFAGDGADSVQDGSGTDGGESGSGTSEADPTPGLDDTSAAGTAGDDDSDEGGSTDLGPSDGGDDCELECSDGGTCELDEDGAPYCSCEAGFAAYGLRCLPCTPTAGSYDVDVSLVVVSATFTLGDGSFPASVYHRGKLLLRDPVSGDEILLGDTRDGDGEASVLPGTYEVHYTWTAGDQVPQNRGAKLSTVVIPDVASHELLVHVPAVQLTGRITFNEATPPTSVYEHGTIVLVDPSTGDEVPLGDTRDGEYEAWVVPGTYRVHYRREVTDGEAPSNGDAFFTEIEVAELGNAQVIDLDVPVATLSGSFTLDGAAPPLSIYENGRIVLRNPDNGDEVVLGTTASGSYQAPVVAGSYQVIYQRLQGGQQVPINRAALLRELTIESGVQALDVNVATAMVTGVITVANDAPPADPGDDGLVLLRNPLTGDEALLGNTANGSYAQRVVQGAYDVYYRQETSSGGVPVNTNARLMAGVDVKGGANLDIDVPMVTVSASITVGGQVPPASVYDDGVLYLRNVQTGDSVLLGNTRLAALERPVVPGTYDVLYVVEAAGPTMPINAQSHLTTVDVGRGAALDVDIPVAVLQGSITQASQPPPQSIYNRAALLLHDVATDDVVYLGPFEAGSFARTLTAGTYVVVYQALATTGLVPANTNAGLACIELTGG